MSKRGKGRKPTEVTSVDLYKQYKDDTFRNVKEGNIRAHIDRESPYYLTQKKFTSILKRLSKKIANLLIYEAFEWSLPSYLGRIAILKSKNRVKELASGELEVKFPVDYKLTRKLGKVVYNPNEHTDGHVMKIVYKRGYVKIPYKSIISFVACRTFKRDLAKAIKTNPDLDYLERC